MIEVYKTGRKELLLIKNQAKSFAAPKYSLKQLSISILVSTKNGM
jgi:hypothetical protein